MEKDYFKDRPKASTLYGEIFIGEPVFICTKEAQKYAETIDDLIFGWVKRKLTKQNHPRGIKVEIIDEEHNIYIGRVVYLVKNNNVFTNEDEKAEKNGEPINYFVPEKKEKIENIVVNEQENEKTNNNSYSKTPYQKKPQGYQKTNDRAKNNADNKTTGFYKKKA